MSPPGKASAGQYEQNSSRNLYDLPIVTHFEKDAGAFVTASIVFAKDGERGNQNSSTHRLLRLDERHMAIRMVEGRHLHKCFTYAKDHGEDLKVAIAIGVHPAASIAAAYQAAYGVDEMTIANALLDNGLKVAKAPYAGVFVPSHAEIVLEGRILKDRVQEEWMVEMLRTYDFKRQQPVFELERIRFRDNAIYHDILPGYAEHRLLMGLPVEAKMYDYVKSVVPTTQAVHLTDGGSNWLSAVIQIKKRLEGEPKNALMAAFAAHPSLKMATVVDEDIDPTDAVAVEYAITTRCQADRSFVIMPNAKGSSLDPSSDQQNLLTTKVGIDATATLLKPKERFEIAKIPGQEKVDARDYVSKD
jgi:UbiD family decarboxylase